ncbi:MAG TPA: SurA N-terminal domain-containing protein [Candidatus Angelobacter sp.]|nr:SurA N-terminal domain-containing protein [Candidatus Angelobacter sp.]
MRLCFQLVLVMAIASACSAQVVDRMVAVVNKRVILESELDQTVRLEFLMAGKPLDKATEADRMATLDRLIDRSLLDQQAVRTEMLDPEPQELADKVTEIRRQLPDAQTEEGWHNILNDYGLTQQDVEENLKSQMRILRLIDMRFRGLVRVDPSAIETYYNQTLLPQLKAHGAAAPPLNEVSQKIEQILVEQGIDEMLARWMDTLRGQAHIEKMIGNGSESHEARP